jgi:hypothetical protein
MGNFLELARVVVTKIGGIIMEAINWVTKKIRADIEKKTYQKLEDNKEDIQKAKDPKTVGKIFAIDTAINALEKVKNDLGKTLDSGDKNILIGKLNIQININN